MGAETRIVCPKFMLAKKGSRPKMHAEGKVIYTASEFHNMYTL